jgi:tetrahydromethanopterin S-methyltransferase subunit G
MTDQEFREMLLTSLAEIKAQRREDNERLEKRLDSIETQREKDNERLEKRLDSMETHVAQVRQDVGWIKGKLEGKQEGSGRMLTVFTTGAAIAAVIIALIALFS